MNRIYMLVASIAVIALLAQVYHERKSGVIGKVQTKPLTNGVWKSILVVLLSVVFYRPCLAQSSPSTGQQSNVQSSGDSTPLPLSNFISYGDMDYRNNNFAARVSSNGNGGTEDYRTHFIAESYNRLLLTKSFIQPYVELDGSYSSGDVSQENVLLPGIGFQCYPLAANHSPYLPGFINDGRFYVEYAGQYFLQSPNPQWNPRQNLNVGFESYTEYGADNSNKDVSTRKFSDFYLGAAYYTTDFYIPRPTRGGVHGGADIKTGYAILNKQDRIFPYLVLDCNLDSQNYYWQNRVWGGPGIKKEFPFGGDKRIWIYAEQRYVINYPRTSPPTSEGVAYNDTWIGVAYEWNLYQTF